MNKDNIKFELLNTPTNIIADECLSGYISYVDKNQIICVFTANDSTTRVITIPKEKINLKNPKKYQHIVLKIVSDGEIIKYWFEKIKLLPLDKETIEKISKEIDDMFDFDI
jgi:hypothetical protein